MHSLLKGLHQRISRRATAGFHAPNELNQIKKTFLHNGSICPGGPALNEMPDSTRLICLLLSTSGNIVLYLGSKYFKDCSGVI